MKQEYIINNQNFMKWYHEKATEQERVLSDMVGAFWHLFSDMCFQPGTSSYNLIQAKVKNAHSDEEEDFEAPIPEILNYLTYTFFRYKVESLTDCDGYYSHSEQILCISPEYLQDDATILHELIHLHERIIDDLPMHYHDMLFWALYTDLRKKIPDLDEEITEHAHILNESELYASGGTHDILFLLKSFDLDIQKGYPLGTVFGYGRSNYFKDIQYIK